MPEYHAGQRVEVWFAGWNQWIAGEVVRTGFFGSVPCAIVKMDGITDTGAFRLDQLRAQEGLFGEGVSG